jgi:hypothetical protein
MANFAERWRIWKSPPKSHLCHARDFTCPLDDRSHHATSAPGFLSTFWVRHFPASARVFLAPWSCVLAPSQPHFPTSKKRMGYVGHELGDGEASRRRLAFCRAQDSINFYGKGTWCVFSLPPHPPPPEQSMFDQLAMHAASYSSPASRHTGCDHQGIPGHGFNPQS